MIPRIVAEPQLETAMGVFNITLQASFAVGFAFLGPLLVTHRRTVVRARRGHGPLRGRDVADSGCRRRRPPLSSPASRAGRSTNRSASCARDSRRSGTTARSAGRCCTWPRRRPSSASSASWVRPSPPRSGSTRRTLIVVVLPLGLGVVGGVLGLRRFGDGVPRRRAGEAGLVVFGLAVDRSSRSSGRSLGAPGAVDHPARRGAGVLAGAAYAATVGVRPDRPVRAHARRRFAAGSSGSWPRS